MMNKPISITMLTLRIKAIIVLVLCSVLHVVAQEIALPYYNSFENTAENGEWTLNAGDEGAECTDKWYVGSLESIAPVDGDNALYISNCNGDSAHYGKNNNVLVAYRRIALPATVTQAKWLELNFHWKTLAPAKSTTGLYVALIDDAFPIPVESENKTGTEPAWLSANKLTLNGNTTVLQNNGAWNNANTRLNMSPGVVYKLIFVWINDGKSGDIERTLSACIDNMQITDYTCPMPTDLEVESGCDSVRVTWKGAVSSYELQYRLSDTEQWNVMDGIAGGYCGVPNLKEGIYDFRVRAVGRDGMTSAWAYMYEKLVFCVNNHCVNYIDLNDPKIRCWTGSAMIGGGFNPSEPVDYGYYSEASRHTVHWKPDEYDPRTLNGLKTVPDGELASIRIGDYLSGANAERIEIEYTVDAVNTPILLMNYAVVFEEPDHDKEEQPYFKLVLLTSEGYEINPTCGKAEFYADPESKEWRRDTWEGRIVAWKNWATIGFDLSLYDGETITIQIESRDCAQGAHFAYAYFTLDCASGTIEGISCGADPMMDLQAPPGFDYRWYTSTDTTTIGRGQIYTAEASDTATYICDVMFQQNNECMFTVETNVSPRLPHAEFRYDLVPENCENYVRFINTSHVDSYDANGTMHKKDVPVEEVWWYIDNEPVRYGDTIRYSVAREGATVHVKVVAQLSGGACMDSVETDVFIPSILSDSVVVDTVLCWGESMSFEGSVFGKDTLHRVVLPNHAGCDSVRILRLDVKERIEPTVVDTTICFGDSVEFNGRYFKAAGAYDFHLSTEEMCDSLVTLNLFVLPEITFTAVAHDEAGEPNSGSIEIEDAPEGYTYSVNGEVGGALTGLRGGNYEIIVFSNGCSSEPQTVTVNSECIDVSLPDDMPSACADDTSLYIGVEPVKGFLSKYSIRFGDKAHEAGFVDEDSVEFACAEILIRMPDSCRANIYDAELTVHDDICGDTLIPLRFAVYYSSSIVRQKWNNVLAVTNESYNGGYSFAAFQWYANGEPLAGETESYLYLGEFAALDTAAEYSVMLTRTDDGVSLPTCPVIPTMRMDTVEYPVQSVTAAGSRMMIANVRGKSTVRIYSVSGIMCTEAEIGCGNCEVEMPDMPGVYIMTIECGGSVSSHKILLR